MTSLPIFVPEQEVQEFGPDNTYRWATITDTDPLRIRLDGDTVGLPVTPDSIVDPTALAIGDRVWVQLFGRRLLVLGRAGGDFHPLDLDLWQAPSFLNAWEDYGGAFTPIAYVKRGKMVHLQGLMKGGTAGTGSTGNAFILPAGYRPWGVEIFLQASVLGSASVYVYNTGDVRVVGYGSPGSNSWVSLSGIQFEAVQ